MPAAVSEHNPPIFDNTYPHQRHFSLEKMLNKTIDSVASPLELLWRESQKRHFLSQRDQSGDKINLVSYYVGTFISLSVILVDL